MSVNSGWGRLTWGQAQWNEDSALATGWGAKSWGDGEWGTLADETVTLTGFSITSTLSPILLPSLQSLDLDTQHNPVSSLTIERRICLDEYFAIQSWRRSHEPF